MLCLSHNGVHKLTPAKENIATKSKQVKVNVYLTIKHTFKLLLFFWHKEIHCKQQYFVSSYVFFIFHYKQHLQTPPNMIGMGSGVRGMEFGVSPTQEAQSLHTAQAWTRFSRQDEMAGASRRSSTSR